MQNYNCIISHNVNGEVAQETARNHARNRYPVLGTCPTQRGGTT